MYRTFFRLVLMEGLSPMEALSFDLVRVGGLTPKEASSKIEEMLDKEVKRQKISVYVDRARIKLIDNGTIHEYGEFDLEKQR